MCAGEPCVEWDAPVCMAYSFKTNCERYVFLMIFSYILLLYVTQSNQVRLNRILTGLRDIWRNKKINKQNKQTNMVNVLSGAEIERDIFTYIYSKFWSRFSIPLCLSQNFIFHGLCVSACVLVCAVLERWQFLGAFSVKSKWTEYAICFTFFFHLYQR